VIASPRVPGGGQPVGEQGEQEQGEHGEQRRGDEVQGDVEGEDVHPQHVQHAEAEEEDVGDGAVEVPEPTGPHGVTAPDAGSRSRRLVATRRSTVSAARPSAPPNRPRSQKWNCAPSWA
jgi:hypothetical protein